eukprot:TRINITY_DN11124_c0_g1_i1.p1 TRINITY_DN11124_c0_g1~~TRINITY_DN11124_c0_g1_i1.p1  ORF type:complete len:513 (-),score=84.28 TRINITY_DN11124_c0_g1_i1:47-1585(-)
MEPRNRSRSTSTVGSPAKMMYSPLRHTARDVPLSAALPSLSSLSSLRRRRADTAEHCSPFIMSSNNTKSNTSSAEPQSTQPMEPPPAAAAAAATTATDTHLTPTQASADKSAGLFSFLLQRIGHGSLESSTQMEAEERDIFTSLSVPLEMEKTVLLGVLMCLHTFLATFTLTPLRLLWLIASKFWNRQNKILYEVGCSIIFVTCVIVISQVDGGVIYHYIRGQSVVKLYVLFNALELLDKLACAFGQDSFYSLKYALCTGSSIIRGITLFFITQFFSIAHSFLLFTQVTTLNAAINSENLALLTLLVSSNMIEIKGAVFKRFETENIFQICFIDIMERFQLLVFLSIIAMNNLSSLNWDIFGNFDVVLTISISMLIVWCSEMVVDTIKHFYVNKFNKSDLLNYKNYRTVMCNDIAGISKAKGLISSITSRMGFVPIPICSVVLRVVIFSFPASHRLSSLVVLWVVTLLTVLLLRTILFIIIESHQSSTLSNEELEKLSAVVRYKMTKGRIPG